MKVVKRFILEVEVDEEKAKKFYPNYRFGFSNVRQFIRFLVAEIPQRKMKYGFRITLKPYVKPPASTKPGLFY